MASKTYTEKKKTSDTQSNMISDTQTDMRSDTQTDMTTYMHTFSLSDKDIGIYVIFMQRHIKSYISMIIMSLTVKTQ